MLDLAQAINANPYLSLLIALWVLPWKGVALWKAARREQKWWFIPLLIINTVGLLEIAYIFIFSKLGKKLGKK
jgi:hypothetical protein